MLTPPEVVVFEGGTATFTCSPYAPPETLNLIRQDATIVQDPRLSYRDFEVPGSFFMSNRTYTLMNVEREDDGTRFRCTLSGSGIVSTETLIRVYGKKIHLLQSILLQIIAE